MFWCIYSLCKPLTRLRCQFQGGGRTGTCCAQWVEHSLHLPTCLRDRTSQHWFSSSQFTINKVQVPCPDSIYCVKSIVHLGPALWGQWLCLTLPLESPTVCYTGCYLTAPLLNYKLDPLSVSTDLGFNIQLSKHPVFPRSRTSPYSSCTCLDSAYRVSSSSVSSCQIPVTSFPLTFSHRDRLPHLFKTISFL